jgi:hypothetical protein
VTNLIVAPDVAVLVPCLVSGVVEARPLLQDGVVEGVRLAAALLTSLQNDEQMFSKKKSLLEVSEAPFSSKVLPTENTE